MRLWVKLIVGSLLLKDMVYRYANNVIAKIDYRFEALKFSDFKIRFEDEKMKLVVIPKMFITNRNPFDIDINTVNITFSQSGQKLGVITTTNTISFTSMQEKKLAFEAVLDSEDLVQEIKNLIDGKVTVYTPIIAKGKVAMSNGAVFSINEELKLEK